MRARLVRIDDLSAQEVDAWSRLAASAAEPNPFFEPEFVLPLARHHGLEMRLLTVDIGTDMVACLPLWGHERLRRLLPAWTAPSALGVPLVTGEHATSALPLAIEHLSRRAGLRRLLSVDRVPADGLVGPAFSGAVSRRRLRWERPLTAVCPVVRRRPTASYLDETLRGNQRRNVGRKRRSLERELGSPIVLVQAEAAPSAVEKFLAMEASGWKGQAGTAMLCDPRRAAFFRDMCARFSAAGRLRLSSLAAGDTSVAMKCEAVSGRCLFNLKMAYDARFARFSPGVLLEIEAVRRFHASDYDSMDSCTTHATSPQFWLYPDTRALSRVIVALGGPVDRMVLSGLEAAGRLGRRLVRRPATP